MGGVEQNHFSELKNFPDFSPIFRKLALFYSYIIDIKGNYCFFRLRIFRKIAVFFRKNPQKTPHFPQIFRKKKGAAAPLSHSLPSRPITWAALAVLHLSGVA